VAQIINNPDPKPPKVSTAADVHYFFEKIGAKQVCKECAYVFLLSSLGSFFPDRANRKIREADPANWISKKYEYAEKTSNPNLRVHIENFHKEQFVRLAKERNWKVQLKGLRSQAQSQAASEASMPGQHEKFDEPTFQRYLSNFIIVDDQVRSRLMSVTILTFYLVYQRCGLS
jgi:hypothetical protein